MAPPPQVDLRTPGERLWRAAALVAIGLLGVCAGLLHRPGHLLGETAGRDAPLPAAAYPAELSRVTVVAAGDVIPHGNVKKAAAEALAALPAGSPPGAGWGSLFSEVSDLFRAADVGFVNLETPVCPESSQGSAPYVFDAPPDLLDALVRDHISVVSFANNHVFDQGQKGFEESLRHLAQKGVLGTGAGASEAAAWEAAVVEKNGIRLGFLSMTRWLNGNKNPDRADRPHVAFLPYPGDTTPGGLPPEAALAAVRAARARCDLLFVSVHWGTEYAEAPRDEDRRLAADLVEAGADVVLGHHPHVLQPVETRLTADGRPGLIFYSFGNFLSNQAREYLQGVTPEKTGEMRDSLVASFCLVRRDYGHGRIRAELGPVALYPAWTDNSALASAATGEALTIRPVLIDRELPTARARLAALLFPGPALTPELPRAAARAALLARRRDLIAARLGTTYLAPPPPRGE